MKKAKKIFLLLVLILTNIFYLGTANMFLLGAAGSESNQILVAEEKISSLGITWIPRSIYSHVELRVGLPNGAIFYETFEPGTNPTFGLSNFCGDGTYTYELRPMPSSSPAVRREANLDIHGGKKSNPEEVVLSGNFQVKEGVIITSPEPISRPLDIVQNDDLIITGGTCVGSGCATDGSETFGYDSIKIKNANPRIFFDDISSPPYAFNDWRILINDSSIGGASHFSIEDSTAGRKVFTVKAGARANALYIDNTGYVGLGTSVPAESLHITNCDTPAIRLEQTTCLGYPGQKWDLIGNELAFSVRDFTDTANTTLPLMIEARAPWYTLYLKSDGKIGVGTNTPTHLIHLSGGAYSDGGTWVNSSSRVLKENICNLETGEAVKALNNLNPVKFNYKTDKEEQYLGFIAEDVPELVATKDHKGMSPMDVVAVLTKVLQEHQKIIQEQNKTITELKAKIMELEKSKE